VDLSEEKIRRVLDEESSMPWERVDYADAGLTVVFASVADKNNNSVADKNIKNINNKDTGSESGSESGSSESDSTEEGEGVHNGDDKQSVELSDLAAPMHETTLRDIELYKMHTEGSEVKRVKVAGTVPVEPTEIYNFFCSLDEDTRKQYDENLIEYKVMDKPAPPVTVVRCRYLAPFPLRNREFLTLNTKRVVKQHTAGDAPDSFSFVYIIDSFTIERKDIPPDPDYVRADVITNSIIFRHSTLNPHYTHITKIFQIDPKGSIPCWLVNFGMEKQADFIVSLRKMFCTSKR